MFRVDVLGTEQGNLVRMVSSAANGDEIAGTWMQAQSLVLGVGRRQRQVRGHCVDRGCKPAGGRWRRRTATAVAGLRGAVAAEQHGPRPSNGRGLWPGHCTDRPEPILPSRLSTKRSAAHRCPIGSSRYIQRHQSRRLRVRAIAMLSMTTMKMPSAASSGHRSCRVEARSMMPRIRRMKCVIGKISASHCAGRGMPA